MPDYRTVVDWPSDSPTPPWFLLLSKQSPKLFLLSFLFLLIEFLLIQVKRFLCLSVQPRFPISMLTSKP